jgi:hypothetical protein
VLLFVVSSTLSAQKRDGHERMEAALAGRMPLQPGPVRDQPAATADHGMPLHRLPAHERQCLPCADRRVHKERAAAGLTALRVRKRSLTVVAIAAKPTSTSLKWIGHPELFVDDLAVLEVFGI